MLARDCLLVSPGSSEDPPYAYSMFTRKLNVFGALDEKCQNPEKHE